MTDILTQGREIAERFNRNGEGFDNIGKKNAYECEDCRSHIVTIDRHHGVTPFMTRCGNCKGMAKSKMYRVAESLVETHEWYRPERLEDIPRGSEEHISRGGLILREIDGERGWTRGYSTKSTAYDDLRHDAHTAEKLEGLLAEAEAPNTKTRQQIRHAKRKDRTAPAEIIMFGRRYRRVD